MHAEHARMDILDVTASQTGPLNALARYGLVIDRMVPYGSCLHGFGRLCRCSCYATTCTTPHGHVISPRVQAQCSKPSRCELRS